jgi:hypothetical protein
VVLAAKKGGKQMQETKVETTDHLVLNQQSGFIEDIHIEHIYNDLYTDTADADTVHGLNHYAKMLLSEDAPPASLTILTDTEDALRWAQHFGFVTTWALGSDDLKANPEAKRLGLKFGGKIGQLNVGQCVFAKSVRLAALLAATQMLRELYHQLNNRHRLDRKIARH